MTADSDAPSDAPAPQQATPRPRDSADPATAGGRPAPSRGIPPQPLLALYIGLALAPVGLAAVPDLAPRPFWDDFASALGLIGFSLMLLEFVLSGRYRAVSGRIGIDLTMRFHQLIPRALVLLMLLHPFLYTTPMGPELPWDTGGQARLGLDGWSILTGALAWPALIVLIATAIGRRKLPYAYEGWRIGHALGAVLLVGLVAHHALAAGRYSQTTILIAFWAAMIALAAATLIYIYGIRPLLQRRHPYRVQQVRRLAAQTWELRLRAEGGPALGFHPGQFVWLKVGDGPFRLREHPFSISSAPQEAPEIGFTIREAGDFTGGVLPYLEPGTPAYLDGPHGNFIPQQHADPDRDAGPLAYLAGGVGIAPILSHLRAFRAAGDRRPLLLVYGNTTEDQIAARDELAAMQRELNLSVHHVLRDPPAGWPGHTGMMTRDVLETCLPAENRDDWRYFICGPGPMIDASEDALRALGVPLHRIVSERFDYD